MPINTEPGKERLVNNSPSLREPLPPLAPNIERQLTSLSVAAFMLLVGYHLQTHEPQLLMETASFLKTHGLSSMLVAVPNALAGIAGFAPTARRILTGDSTLTDTELITAAGSLIGNALVAGSLDGTMYTYMNAL